MMMRPPPWVDAMLVYQSIVVLSLLGVASVFRASAHAHRSRADELAYAALLLTAFVLLTGFASLASTTFSRMLAVRASLWFVACAVLVSAFIATPRRAPPAIDGIPCTPDPRKGHHQDVHVSLFVHGRQVAFPRAVGMIAPRVAPYPSGPYAGGAYAGDDDCVYWMHTHDATGIVHVEPQFPGQTFTLRQLFDVWGQPLSRTQLATYRGTVRVFRWNDDDARRRIVEAAGDPGAALLAHRTHDEVAIESGPPWAPPPRFVWYPRRATHGAIVLAKGGTIGAPGAPPPDVRRHVDLVRAVAGVLLIAAAIAAAVDWYAQVARGRGRLQWT